jgi:hypothetical protein
MGILVKLMKAERRDTFDAMIPDLTPAVADEFVK